GAQVTPSVHGYSARRQRAPRPDEGGAGGSERAALANDRYGLDTLLRPERQQCGDDATSHHVLAVPVGYDQEGSLGGHASCGSGGSGPSPHASLWRSTSKAVRLPLVTSCRPCAAAVRRMVSP